MEIIYTQDSVEGEPGPNLYWRGPREEYLRLLCDLHSLGVEAGTAVRLERLDYIKLIGLRSYEATNSADFDCVAQVVDGVASSRLSAVRWQQFLHNVLSLTFGAGFVFQEFAGIEAPTNVIMSSIA